MADILDRFFDSVHEIFSFLPQRGFRVPAGGVERTPINGSVSFMGREVGFVFAYDMREGVCECYVGRVSDGTFNKIRSNGGYWASLYSFLVQRRNYRGKIPIPPESSGSEFPMLYGFRVLLQTKAIDLLEDRASALDV